MPPSGRPAPRPRQRPRAIQLLKALGPGLVSGASDNDPTTVATMAVAGASTGFALSWLVILVYPMLASVQIISAQVGLVARSGLQLLVRRHYGRGWGIVLLVSVLAVNAVTIGADLEAGAAALGLLFHADLRLFVVPYAVGVVALLFLGNYHSFVRVLKYVLFVFLAYVVSAFLAHPDWGAVARATFLPHISLDPQYVQAALAVLGTTLTSYAYIWETQEEAEERQPLNKLGLARADAGIGMLVAVSIFWFIMISSGATFAAHHQQIQTAEQAAQSLKPLAGPLASLLFAVGLLASSLIAVPVLAATSPYLVCQEFGWRAGISAPVGRARRFYMLIVAGMMVAAAIALSGVSPIQLLLIASIAGGLGTPIGLVFLLLIAHSQKVMKDHPIGGTLLTIGWLTTALVSAVSAFFLWQQFASKLIGH